MTYKNTVESSGKMLTLTAYKIPMFISSLDHTYVKKTQPELCDPFFFPCCGRSAGGTELFSENCMQGPFNSLVYEVGLNMGIRYGFQGVCHQIANRVLYYTTRTLYGCDVGGYGASSFVYGTYGRFSTDKFFKIAAKCRSKNNFAINSETRSQSLSGDDKEKAFIKKVVDLYSESIQNSKPNYTITREEGYSLQSKELELMLEFVFGDSLDSLNQSAIINEQQKFLKEMDKIADEEYNDHDIHYCIDVDNLFVETLNNLTEYLDQNDFKKLLNINTSSIHEFTLIDPNAVDENHQPI
jgi:hypothetical protein